MHLVQGACKQLRPEQREWCLCILPMSFPLDLVLGLGTLRVASGLQGAEQSLSLLEASVVLHFRELCVTALLISVGFVSSVGCTNRLSIWSAGQKSRGRKSAAEGTHALTKKTFACRISVTLLLSVLVATSNVS